MPAPIVIAAAAGTALNLLKKHPWIIPTAIIGSILPLFLIITVIGGTLTGLQTVQVFNFGGNCVTEEDGNFLENLDAFDTATSDCEDVSNQNYAVDGEWVYPVDPQYAYITSPYGWRGFPAGFHDAVDLNAPYGAPVYAAQNGTVSFVDRGNGATGFCGQGALASGAGVGIKHANEVETLYWHLTPVSSLKAGEEVKGGQLLGHVANKGWVCGAHLHFSVSVGGHYPQYNKDPEIWFREAGTPLRRW